MDAITSTEQDLFAFDKGTNTFYLGKTAYGSHIYSGEALQEFAVGAIANGGYVVSVMFDAVLQHYSQRYQVDPIALNAFFLRKSELGAVIVEIEDLKVNRKGYCVSKAAIKQTKTVAKSRLQHLEDYHPEDYVEKVVGIFTMGNMDQEKGLSSDHHANIPVRPDQRVLTPYQFDNLNDLIYIKVDPNFIPDPKESKPMEMHQIIEFRDQRPIDFKSMPFWCDMLVPPPNNLGPTVLNGKLWCATMQLEVQFKQKCPSGLTKVGASFITNTLKNSRFDLDGWIWDCSGNLLATTRHQCLSLPWERNTPKSKL